MSDSAQLSPVARFFLYLCGIILATMDFSKEIEELLSDRKKFNDTIYTPIIEAIAEHELRLKDNLLSKAISDYLGGSIPKEVEKGFRAIFSRHITTPNYEARRFMIIPDTTKLKPLFWEYHDDKFTSNNTLKHRLGKMVLYEGKGKKGGDKVVYENIIDFNVSNGKKIRQVETLWGQSLVDFHHELLNSAYPHLEGHIFDASDWFYKHGGTAKDYYLKFVAIFVRNGILFENFILSGDELNFTKEVFLPAFFFVWKYFGKKPLIVALEPTEIEGDDFWTYHPIETAEIIKTKRTPQLEV